MQIIINPDKSVWDKMCERNAPSDDKVIESVRSIVAEVRHSGDEALRRFAHDFDHADITDVELSAEERKQLAAKVTPQVRQAIDAALVNISAFHKAQMPEPVEVET